MSYKSLLMAAKKGNLEEMIIIAEEIRGINRGMTVRHVFESAVDDRGDSVLHKGAAAIPHDGAAQVCQHLVLQVQMGVNLRNDEGDCALHIAIKAQNVSVAQLLLANGADVSLMNILRYAPLHTAARMGNIEIMQMLIAHQANNMINSSCFSGTPLQIAASNGDEDAIRVLLDRGAMVEANSIVSYVPPSPLFRAVEASSFECVRRLLHAGASPDNVDDVMRFVTPLGKAAAECSTIFIRSLLERRANPNRTDYTRMVPLLRAALNDRYESVIELFNRTNAVGIFDLTWTINGIMHDIHTPEATTRRNALNIRTARRFRSMATTDFGSGDYHDATHLLSLAIELNPRDARLYTMRSRCYARLRAGNLALRDAESSIRMSPDSPESYYRKAVAHKILGERFKAASAYYIANRKGMWNYDYLHAFNHLLRCYSLELKLWIHRAIKENLLIDDEVEVCSESDV